MRYANGAPTFQGRELKAVLAMREKVKEIVVTLDTAPLQESQEISVAVEGAMTAAVRLGVWLEEITWIAARELCPQSPVAKQARAHNHA